MYYKYWGLLKNPFDIHPDPDFLYLSEQHREALSHLKYAVLAKKPFLLLTGDIGVGKTTLLNYFLRDLEKDKNVVVVPVFNPSLSVSEFYELLSQTLFPRQDVSNISKPIFLLKFREQLKKIYQQGKILVLVIDEAQSASIRFLEELRLFANIAAEFPGMVIILVGQPDLLDKLDCPELTSLRQRFSFKYHLGPFRDIKDVSDYISTRLLRAGSPKNRVFTDDAIEALFKFSGGIPRVINILADHALMSAFLAKAELVDASFVEEASKEVKHLLPKLQKDQHLEAKNSKSNFERYIPFIFLVVMSILILGYLLGLWDWERLKGLWDLG